MYPLTDKAVRKAKKWRHPTGAPLCLLNAAHARAVLHEPTSEFPGLDIDAIYFKREADAILRSIQELEPA